MKILVFTGGLGNQIFEYAFYLHLKRNFPNEYFYGLYGKKLAEHHGLELDKWFYVSLPPQPWWVLPVTGCFYLYKQCIPDSQLLDLDQLEWIHPKAKVFFPFKFNKKYIPSEKEWLRWKIDEVTLSDVNKDVLSEIRKTNSCFVHIRRGDYLAPAYKNLFEECCTLEYYREAVALMKQKYPDVRFICFSDDMAWVRNELKLGNDVLYVDWNIGKNSPLDMYIMSQCKCAIIANSTFSYWGARLGAYKESVVYPQKWWNNEKGNPDIFMEDWVGI